MGIERSSKAKPRPQHSARANTRPQHKDLYSIRMEFLRARIRARQKAQAEKVHREYLCKKGKSLSTKESWAVNEGSFVGAAISAGAAYALGAPMAVGLTAAAVGGAAVGGTAYCIANEQCRNEAIIYAPGNPVGSSGIENLLVSLAIQGSVHLYERWKAWKSCDCKTDF